MLIKLERELNQSLLSELTPEQREQFDRLVGKPLELERGNLEFHWEFVKRPDEPWSSIDEPIWMDDVQVDGKKIQTDEN